MPRASTARKGATHASRADLNPLHLVQEVKNKYPEAANDEVIRRVRALLSSTKARYQEAFDTYAIHNLIRTIERDQEIARSGGAKVVSPFATGGKGEGNKADAPNIAPKQLPPPKTAAELEDERHEIEKRRIAERDHAKAAVKLVLLDLVAPNGKLWRDLSIAEYMKIGERQFKHGKSMIDAGHAQTELLVKATSEAELATVFKS